MTTFHYPIPPKYLPALKVTGKWPYAVIEYQVNARGVQVEAIAIHPRILANITDLPWLVAEIEQAAINNASQIDTGKEEAREHWKRENHW